MPIEWNEKRNKWISRCGFCGAIDPIGFTTTTSKNEKGDYVEWCSECSVSSLPLDPDVFWDGEPEINLADDPNTGKPRVFSSKIEKARYLKERGIVEGGDKVHGAFPRVTNRVERKTDERPQIREILHIWKQMGRDRQKEEYRKIIHRANRQG